MHRQAPGLGALFLLLGSAGGLSACNNGGAVENRADRVEQQATNIVAAVPKPRMFDRADLLEAVRLAASAAATGTDDSAEQRNLDGRQFEVRLRFGCSGPDDDSVGKSLRWTFDEKKRTLRLHAAPTISLDDPQVKAMAPKATEAVEGFWIPRPWIVEASCPAAPATNAAAEQTSETTKTTAAEKPAELPTPTSPRIGIAEFFGSLDARTGRRDQRAFQSTKVLDEGRAPTGAGFNLVLAGRLRTLQDGKVINCTGGRADSPPDCVVSADFDQVWIEWPEDGTIVAQWSRS